MASAIRHAVGHLMLRDIDWPTYGRFLRLFAERPATRLTYDRGNLEIMSPLLHHDNGGCFLARLVVILTEEFGLPILSGGSTTLRRRRHLRGLEPDACFWIANEPRVRGLRRINLRTDPPPDLAIEVDETRSSLNRMAIYGKLGVPEVWRLDAAANLTFHLREADGSYAVRELSVAFPGVSSADLRTFVERRNQEEENALARAFRIWISAIRSSAGAGP